MATFDVSGLDDLIQSLEDVAEMPESVQDEILNAQADIAVPTQQAKARAYGVVDTGMTAGSIRKTRPKRQKDGSKAIYVYPQGFRTRGKGKKTRNAEIAFVQEYGVRGRSPRPFIRDAIAACGEQVVQAAAEIHDKWLKSKNL